LFIPNYISKNEFLLDHSNQIEKFINDLYYYVIMGEKYPMISEKSWWALRESFNKKIPGTVTGSYLVQALNLPSDKGVRSNLILPLQQIGLIDEAGKPTLRAFDWRDEEKYVSVCQEILKEIYPEELIDLLDINVNKEELVRWFMNRNHVGNSSAIKATSTLMIIHKGSGGMVKKEETPIRKRHLTTEKPLVKKRENIKHATADPISIVSARSNVNINININIDSNLQIESLSKIFQNIREIFG